MYSAYELNKQGENILPLCTPFPVWNQSIVPCPVLTVASWHSYSFLRRQARWYGIPYFLINGGYIDFIHHAKLKACIIWPISYHVSHHLTLVITSPVSTSMNLMKSINFYNSHVYVRSWNFSFYVWLISLSVVASKLIYFVSNGRYPF